MADLQDAILCFLVVFWGAESQLCIQSEAAGGSHICRHLCVYTSVWEAAASLHRDSPLEWAQFLAKTEKDSWHRVEQLSLFFFLSFDHMPESQEASELFVGLSHISALTLRCPLAVKLFVFDLF